MVSVVPSVRSPRRSLLRPITTEPVTTRNGSFAAREYVASVVDVHPLSEITRSFTVATQPVP